MNSETTAYDELESFLKAHLRMLGVLFAALTLLSQVGTVAAGNCAYGYGP